MQYQDYNKNIWDTTQPQPHSTKPQLQITGLEECPSETSLSKLVGWFEKASSAVRQQLHKPFAIRSIEEEEVIQSVWGMKSIAFEL